MTSSVVPSFPSATILAQHPGADAFVEAAPATPWRRILAVEPDLSVLHEKSLLLMKANYCVTPASSERELFLLRDTKALPLAILSDHLGRRLLRTVAETVRRQWPRTRILILGPSVMGLEDYLYDEQIYRSSDPKQVLADLEMLYEGMWNQRSNNLDWSAIRSARCFNRPPILESDPTKTIRPAPTEVPSLRGRPSDMRLPVPREN
jgi:hypothetical protein